MSHTYRCVCMEKVRLEEKLSKPEDDPFIAEHNKLRGHHFEYMGVDA
ncbi:MAG: hypothetical protein L0Y56_10685 [Nitrospira sp.]|nr:hypothetical protein [Nitrospira sp.]